MSAKLGGACNYAATAQRSRPRHTCVDSDILVTRSMAYNIRNTGFDFQNDAHPSARHAGPPGSLRRKPSPESSTPQFRTLWLAWLFSDGTARVERYAGQSASYRLSWMCYV